MFVQCPGIRCQSAQIAVHGKVKLGIVILHGAQESVYVYRSRQFLQDFPLQGILRSLVRLHFATGKFPPALPLAIPPLRGKYPPILADNCCYYFYMLHDAFFFNCIRHSFKIGIYTLNYSLTYTSTSTDGQRYARKIQDTRYEVCQSLTTLLMPHIVLFIAHQPLQFFDIG